MIDGEVSDSGDYNEDFRCVQLDTASVEEYLNDLFGEQYTLADFTESATGQIAQGNDGQFYYGCLYINEGTGFNITSISNAANEDGAYTVRVRYIYSIYLSDEIFYVDYQIRPDESATYGCIITGMEQVGGGQDTDAETLDKEVWTTLYTDYLNRIRDNYDEYALIYLDGGTIPMILCYHYESDGGLLLSIQNGAVAEQEVDYDTGSFSYDWLDSMATYETAQVIWVEMYDDLAYYFRYDN